MESLMVEVKSPRYLSKDLFTGVVVCIDDNDNVVKCSCCSFSKQCMLGNANFDSLNILNNFGICVEEEEDSTAVADAGKSSERYSETLHPEVRSEAES